MKNFILILVMLITGLTMNSLHAQGGWSLQTNPLGSGDPAMIGKVQFVSENEGWISTSTSGDLLHTTDAGANWTIVPITSDVVISPSDPTGGLSFISQTTGWVIKMFGTTFNDVHGAVVYKTTDGGVNWQKQIISETVGDAGFQVQFFDANNGWASVLNATTGSKYYKTTNGGTTWNLISTDNSFKICHFIDSNNGWAIDFWSFLDQSTPSKIYHTTNGGASWDEQYQDPSQSHYHAIQFTDINNGWVVGENGKILKTTNGGATWTPFTNTGITADYFGNCIYFMNATTGWIGISNGSMDASKVLHTTNGGANWTIQDTNYHNGNIFSIYFYNENNGWFTGDLGVIGHYSTSSGTYSNATLNGPWFGFLNPLDPYNEQFGYIVFDGIGHIVDGSQFPSQTTGTYAVNPDGSFTATFTNGSETVPFEGQLTSPTEAIGSGPGNTFRFHKIANPGALQDKIAGTLKTTGGCGVRDVTFNIDSNGEIISATGLTGPVTGRVYTDLGVFLGHITTGETTNGWHLFSIKGYYNNSNNNLIGQIEFDWTSCNAGSEAKLVRSDTSVYPSVGIVGDAALGWDTDIAMSTTDGITYKITAYTFKNGGAKFRQDNAWTINWGNASFPSGTGTQDGYNIPVIAGTYNVTFNRNTGAYNFTDPANTDWKLQTNPVNAKADLGKVQFVSATKGWISISPGGLLHTINGGTTWTEVPLDLPEVILSSMTDPAFNMCFINESTGWVLKSLGSDPFQSNGVVVYKTTNGGLNWQKIILSQVPKDMGGQIQFIDENNGYASIVNMDSGLGKYYKTTDGGTTWSLLPSDGTVGIFYPVDLNNAWGILGTFSQTPPFKILHSDNGMTSFTEQWTDDSPGTFWAIQFTDLNHGWVVGQKGKILKTNDGGAYWEPITITGITSDYTCKSVYFMNATTGWIGAQLDGSSDSAIVLHTTNGGTSWTTQSTPAQNPYSIFFWDVNNGWFTSEDNQIARYTGTLGVKENIVDKYLTIYPNPNNGTFYFRLKDANSKIRVEIYNLSGQKVYEASNMENQTTNEINFTPQSKGVYLIKVNDEENSYSEKILIQ